MQKIAASFWFESLHRIRRGGGVVPGPGGDGGKGMRGGLGGHISRAVKWKNKQG